MRESHGLSIEAARDIWINAIRHMLPAVALDPAELPPVFLDSDLSNRRPS